MGLGDVWNRTLVYFGIAEDEEWDDDMTVTNDEVERGYRRRDRANVRRLPAPEQDPWSEPDSVSEPEAAAPPPRPNGARPDARAFVASRPAPRRSGSTSFCRGASTTRNRSPIGSRTRCP